MCGRSALYAALAQPDWMVGNEMVMHGGRRGGIFLSWWGAPRHDSRTAIGSNPSAAR